jgi:excisionase family DNA binding protein
LERILLRVAEAAELLGIGKSTAYELVAEGALPSVRVGKTIRIPNDELRAMIKQKIRVARVEQSSLPREDHSLRRERLS